MAASFKRYAASANDAVLTARQSALYSRADDVRDAFTRDYTRVLHSTAFRRLKHKTQVFYNIANDHICTRMEHVLHVESVASTISAKLGLNVELTRAIALAHDLGHAPFGHQGEKVINKLTEKHLGERFWHERNGLRTVDKLELLEDNERVYRNLDLTYAVRDGIISHCGEVDENNLRPREGRGDLAEFSDAHPEMPATWEGCVVKISDKIAYLGRDIEDAISLGFLTDAAIAQLTEMARLRDERALNTTVIMHNMVIDICEHSSPAAGITLSPECLAQLNEIKAFNYEHIYGNARFGPYIAYSELVITQLFEHLRSYFDGGYTVLRLAYAANSRLNPAGFVRGFSDWLKKYLTGGAPDCANEKLYGALNDEKTYARAVLDYISGMTDRYAIDCFNELITYA
ncbi:MAG: HD domain-containing protein [Oscillospiraceae bacterium]|jgi:dGTPase|nr:HD domain-containing protein [Oscillospiraceae bacterium]